MDVKLREIERQANLTGDFKAYDNALEKIGKKRLVWLNIVAQSMFDCDIVEARVCSQNAGNFILKPASSFRGYHYLITDGNPQDMVCGDTVDAFIMYDGPLPDTAHFMSKVIKILAIHQEAIIVEDYQKPTDISAEIEKWKIKNN